MSWLSELFKPQTLSTVPGEYQGVTQMLGQQFGNMLGQPGGFNLQQFQGPMVAGLNPTQLNAMNQLEFLNNQGPAYTTEQLRGQLQQAATGDPLLDPQSGESLQESVKPYRFDTAATQALQNAMAGGLGQQAPAVTDITGLMDQLGALGQQSPGAISELEGILENSLSTGDFSQAESLFSRLANQPEGTSFDSAGALAQDLASDVQGSDQELSQGFLQDLYGGSGLTPGAQQLQQSGLGALTGALDAPRYDQTEQFQAMDELYNADVEKQLANIREKFSGLGLDAGAADRTGAQARAVGETAAKFRLGQGQMGERSFENAQQRKLAALGQIPGFGQFSQMGQNAQLGALGQLQQSEQRPFMEQMASRQQRGDILPSLMNMEQTPFQEQMALRGQDIQQLPAAMQMGQLPFQQQLAARGQQADIAGLLGQTELGSQGMLADILGQQGQLAQLPFQQGMQQAQLGQGDAALRMNAITQGLGQDQQAFQNMFNVGESAANRRMQSLPYLMQAQQQPFDNLAQLYGIGEMARGVEDTGIQRAMQEFARTQGGRLNQFLGLLGTTPEVGIGPSTVSQVGNLAQGIGSIISGLPMGGGGGGGGVKGGGK